MTGRTRTVVLGIETSCDETGVGVVAVDDRGRVELLADEIASSVDEHARFGGVVPEVASRAHLQAMVPAVHRALATAGVAPARRRRRRRHRRAGAGGGAAGRGRRGQGLRGRLGRAAVRGQPPRRARRRRHAPARPAAAVPGAAGLRRALQPARRPGPRRARSRRSARRSTTRRARPSTRSPGCSGCPSPAARTSTGSGRDGDPAAIAFPRGLTGPRDAPFDFSFSGLKTAVARHVEAAAAGGRAGAGGGRRGELPGGRRRRAHREGRPRGPRAGDGDAACSAAGSRPTPGCARWPQERCDAAGIALRVPRPRLCTDNGAMVAALGAHLLAGGAKPSPLDLPADSSMPVTEVLVS